MKISLTQKGLQLAQSLLQWGKDNEREWDRYPPHPLGPDTTGDAWTLGNDLLLYFDGLGDFPDLHYTCASTSLLREALQFPGASHWCIAEMILACRHLVVDGYVKDISPPVLAVAYLRVLKDFHSAMGSGARLAILHQLDLQGVPLAIQDLTALLHLQEQSVRRHLRILTEVGLVRKSLEVGKGEYSYSKRAMAAYLELTSLAYEREREV